MGMAEGSGLEQSRVQTGEGKRTRCLAFENAYHGDTLGAATLTTAGIYGTFLGGPRERFPLRT